VGFLSVQHSLPTQLQVYHLSAISSPCLKAPAGIGVKQAHCALVTRVSSKREAQRGREAYPYVHSEGWRQTRFQE
jgi:hypothetical protein